MYFGVRVFIEGGVWCAFENVYVLIWFECYFGIVWEGLLQWVIIGYLLVVDVVNDIYMYGYWLVIFVVGVLFFCYCWFDYYLLCNVCLFTGVVGFVIFVLFLMVLLWFMDLLFVDMIMFGVVGYW